MNICPSRRLRENKLITWFFEIIGDSLSSKLKPLSLCKNCISIYSSSFLPFAQSFTTEQTESDEKIFAMSWKNVYLHLIPHRVSLSDYLKSHKMKKYWQLSKKWSVDELNSSWSYMTLRRSALVCGSISFLNLSRISDLNIYQSRSIQIIVKFND